jgi:hypothetical protein
VAGNTYVCGGGLLVEYREIQYLPIILINDRRWSIVQNIRENIFTGNCCQNGD